MKSTNDVQDILLVRYGEIGLRMGNRSAFEKKLIDSIKKNIAPLNDYAVKKERGRIFVYKEKNLDFPFDHESVIEKVKPIMGIVSICPSIEIINIDIENLKVKALEYMNKHYKNDNYSFKVETKRANKNYPITSQKISYEVGGYVFDNSPHLSVDVHNPDITLRVEVREKAYIYAKVIPCFGGLPVGSSGKGMLLLSSGIDSPIAGFLSSKRGVQFEAVYFHSPPYTSERAKEKVTDLCEKLSLYNEGVTLHVVNFTKIQMYLQTTVPPEKITIMLKRQMFRIAEMIAKERNCEILITGDSIGQVASQTLRSISAIDDAVKMSVIRPLATYDKQEIIDIARKIDTFDISTRPFEDCCTLFVPKHPETKPKISIIQSVEQKIIENLETFYIEAINSTECIQF